MNTDININIGNVDFTNNETAAKAGFNSDSLIWRVGRSFLLTTGMIYGLLCLMLLFFQDSLIFNPSRIIENVPMKSGHSFHNVVIKSAPERKINAWFVTSDDNRGTVLYCRGSKGNMSQDLSIIERWNTVGYNIMVFDYQGFGLSQGKPSEENFYKDGEAAFQWLKQKGYIHKNFIVHGRSAGAAVAAKIASEHNCNGLILESAFTSLKKLGSTKLPYLPTSLLLLNNFPTETFLKKTEAPVLVMHSPEDEVIPYKMSQELLNSIPGTKRFFPLKGTHEDGYKNTHGYIRTIKDFADGLILE